MTAYYRPTLVRHPGAKKQNSLLPGKPVPLKLGGRAGLLSTRMREGVWRGRRAFCVGGGPSLKYFDWSLLAGELTIGINRAFEQFDPTIIFSMDTRFWMWLEQGKFGEATRARFDRYSHGLKVWLDTVPGKTPFAEDILTVPYNQKLTGWGTNLEEGLSSGQNSGYSALNLAAILGANPIYLLGYDMVGNRTGGQMWWHDGYPINQNEAVYARFSNAFAEGAAPACRAAGIQVINLNPNSALRCFPFGEMPPPSDMPILISYYTTNNDYAKEVENLKKSLQPWGLKTDIFGMESLGSWQQNIAHKPEFIRTMQRKHLGKPLLYVDADALVVGYPGLFEGMSQKCDIGIHQLQGNHRRELLSGTIYLSATPGARAVVDVWREEMRAFPDVWDQVILQKVLHERANDFRVYDLPPEYCSIFDRSDRPTHPVIEHYQASRRMRNQ